jgi:hypothetical protein
MLRLTRTGASARQAVVAAFRRDATRNRCAATSGGRYDDGSATPSRHGRPGDDKRKRVTGPMFASLSLSRAENMTTLEDWPNTAPVVVDTQNGVVAAAHRRDAVVANIRSLVGNAKCGGCTNDPGRRANGECWSSHQNALFGLTLSSPVSPDSSIYATNWIGTSQAPSYAPKENPQEIEESRPG